MLRNVQKNSIVNLIKVFGSKALQSGLTLGFLLLSTYLSPVLASEPQTLQHLSGHLLYSPDGKYLLRYENKLLQLWGVEGKKLHQQQILKSPITGIDFTPDGKYLATGHQNGSYIVWSSTGLQKKTQFKDFTPGIRAQPFAISPDGRYITLCKTTEKAQHLNMSLHIWDVQTKKTFRIVPLGSWPDELPGHPPSVDLAYHPLGRYLSIAVEWADKSQPKYLKVWDTWKASWAYWVPASPPIFYSNDGHYFGFTEFNAKKSHWQIRLWHTPTNLLKQIPLKVAPPTQFELSLSSTGQFLVIAAEASYKNRAIKVIDTHSLEELLKLVVPKGIDSFSFSKDERSLLLSSRHDPGIKPLIYPLPGKPN